MIAHTFQVVEPSSLLENMVVLHLYYFYNLRTGTQKGLPQHHKLSH